MSSIVTCTCGKSFRAKPELAGKRVKCPACGSVLQIPAATPTPQTAPALTPLPAEPDDPLGLGGFNEQSLGTPLPQASGPQLSRAPARARKKKQDWGPILRIGGIAAGALAGVALLIVVGVFAWSFLFAHRSPEAVFQTAKTATENQDWEKFCDCLTPESQDNLAGMLVYGAMMVRSMSGMAAMAGPDKAREAEEKMKPVMAVLERHGLDEQTLKESQAETQRAVGGNRQEMIQKLVSPIKDRGKFVADMINAMREMGQQENATPFQSDARLEDVKIDGDSATGQIVQTKNGVERKDGIRFQKISGRWKIDLGNPRGF